MSAAEDHTADVDTGVILEWLAALYDHVDDGWLTLFSLDRTTGERHVDWAPVDDYDTFSDAAAKRAPTCCVWWGVATRHQRLPHGRGGTNDCDQIPGLWVDIDIAGPRHRTPHPLPPDLQAARQLLHDFPLEATTVVASGGGLQAWWLFAEPQPAAELEPLLARWGHTWAQTAHKRGWHIDNVFDAARVMRLPGTHNRKTHPVPVTIVAANWDRRYGTDDIDQWLEDPPPPPEPATSERIPYIGPERPGDAFNATHTGVTVLHAAGWTLHHRDRSGDEHWTRPGKERRDGASATVYAEDGHTTIWSDAIPGVETRRPYDPFGLLTVLHYQGDFTTASDALEQQGYGTKTRADDDLSWIATTTSDTPATADSTTPDTPKPTSLIDRLTSALLTTAAIRALPPPEWLIDHYLVRNSLALLYGPSGTYKTFLGIDFALHLATGSWWNRNEITRQGRVLYLIAEGVSGVGGRLDAWQHHHKIHDLDNYEPITWLPRAVNLSDRVEAAALTQLATTQQPDLIIIDTLARCTVGAEENSAKDMGIVVEHLDTLRRATGACVLSVHHTGKEATNGARGSSALRAAMDTELEMASGDPLTLKVTKQKDAPEAGQLHLAPLPVADSCVLLPSRQVAEGSEIGAGQADTLAALEAIAVPGGIAPGVWLKASMTPERTFYRHVAQLLSKGLIRNVGSENRPRYVTVDAAGGPVGEGDDDAF